MIKWENKDVKKLEKDLRDFAKRSYPFAVKETLNALAWDARRNAQIKVAQDMILRNKWTKGSVQVRQVSGLRVNAMESATGSTEDYMRVQEMGDVERKKGKHGLSIPTAYSAGQEKARPRTRLPRRANRLANIQLRRFRARGKNTKQRLVSAMNQAVKSNKKFIFLEVGTHNVRTGIFKILGGTYTGRGWPKGARLKMVYDLSHSFVTIPPSPWLKPSALQANKRVETFYRKALVFQLKRHRLFK